MDLESLLNQVKQMIFREPSTPHNESNDPGGLIGNIENLFRQQQPQQPAGYNVRPASEDPLGDPADLLPSGSRGYGYMQGNETAQQFPNLRPASEDPLGDPADQEAYVQPASGQSYQQQQQRQFPNLRPASEDPLGDPADRQ